MCGKMVQSDECVEICRVREEFEIWRGRGRNFELPLYLGIYGLKLAKSLIKLENPSLCGINMVINGGEPRNFMEKSWGSKITLTMVSTD